VSQQGFPSPGGLFAPLAPLLETIPFVPDLTALNLLAARRDLRNQAGQRVSFILPPTDRLDYETRIWRNGAVATRPDNWHDFFNALVWLSFPLTKAALNARHAGLLMQDAAARGRERDAMTHFDECGVVVLAGDPALLDLLRRFAWRSLFWERRTDLAGSMRCLVFGHATYEQLRQPFRGLTAKAVLYEVSPSWFSRPLVTQLAEVDRRLAAEFAAGCYPHPRSFQPFPLMGLPGVTPANETASYYDDRWQFRPGRGRRGV